VSEKSPASARRSGWWQRRVIEDGVLIGIAVVVAILVRGVVAQVYYIPSASMVPQLRVDDRIVVSRLAYHLHPVHRGDIVVFKAPPGLESTGHASSDPLVRMVHGIGVALGMAEDETVLVKRVVGLPGETISAHGGRVYVGSDLLVEPYLPAGTVTSSFGPVRVPAGDVWVMGDNRGDSEDSRVFGPIPERSIIGRAIWKVWPPWKACFL
jgi:signal peptidase I